ncbi:hypothetical protein GCM10023321_64790 [Pseudonocardia eucalypti]|uniref:Secreted protein n=1 Tax=Pseudonocardia eucalypti TaxID=648755 RepID=A0ABP9QY35_9PSEU|nr:hypothetical protein [Pseudonocardia eucalypti]
MRKLHKVAVPASVTTAAMLIGSGTAFAQDAGAGAAAGGSVDVGGLLGGLGSALGGLPIVGGLLSSILGLIGL